MHSQATHRRPHDCLLPAAQPQPGRCEAAAACKASLTFLGTVNSGAARAWPSWPVVARPPQKPAASPTAPSEFSWWLAPGCLSSAVLRSVSLSLHPMRVARTALKVSFVTSSSSSLTRSSLFPSDSSSPCCPRCLSELLLLTSLRYAPPLRVSAYDLPHQQGEAWFATPGRVSV